LENEYRRRLTRYQLTDRLLTSKYGMSFQDFEAKEMVKARGYSWEVESDAQEWEMAVDGVCTMERLLEELTGVVSHAAG
jgi:hypothetical protein